MNRLLEIGFEPAGHWSVDRDKLSFELTRHATQKNILYAFVCDGQVKYVGKTVRSLHDRMAGYRTPSRTQKTNMRNHDLIRRMLSDDAAVEILALPDNGLLHYGRFHLNLAAALEDDIIRVISPEWNGGVRESLEASLETKTPSEEPTRNSRAEFCFTLQPTYYKTGFFNVRVADEKNLGKDDQTIELFLGRDSEPTLGTINRRANSNGTPRVMGGTGLRDWFRSNATQGDNIQVTVYSPTSIRLMSPAAVEREYVE